MIRFFWPTVAAAALLAAAPGHASEPVVHAEVAGWTVGRTDDDCSIYMSFEGPGETQLYVAKGLDGRFSLAISNNNWSAEKGQTYNVRIELYRHSFGGKATGIRPSPLGGGFALRFGPEFETDLVRGSTLYVVLDDKLIDRLSLNGTSAAMASLNRCLQLVRSQRAAAEREARRWQDIPVDPFSPAPGFRPPSGLTPSPPKRLSAPATPHGSVASWISNNDYPLAAIREGRSGRVEYIVTVNPEGRVTDCRISKSSGSPDLDITACAIIRRRARFDPATDAQGDPVEGTWSSAMIWSIPK